MNIQEFENESLKKSRKKMNEEACENSKILEFIDKKYFELRKELLILSGTIFGSSIALSTGKQIGPFFTIGELFLLISIVSGMILLLTQLKAKEWTYSFNSKNSINFFLILHKNNISDFELKNLQKISSDYEKLMNSNQNGLIYKLLKLVPLEKWQNILNSSFFTGIFLIFLSIIQF